MEIWQLQEAKAKLTEVINECKFQPQFISRRGVNEAVVLNIQKYTELLQLKENVVSFFRNSPLSETNINFTRDKQEMREIEL